MTTKPGCRDVERLIAGSDDGELRPGERALVEEHLRGCAPCRSFAADRDIIRKGAAAARWPALPDELDRRTRRVLGQGGREAPTAASVTAAAPAWLLVALAVVTIVTGIWLAASLANVTPDMTLADLPPAGLAAVFIIIQNALTLLLAPVVLRTFRARRRAAGSA